MKRTVSWLVLAALSVALLEISSLAALFALNGNHLAWGDYANARLDRMAWLGRYREDPESTGIEGSALAVGPIVAHPYMGFVHDLDNVKQSWGLEFTEHGWAIPPGSELRHEGSPFVIGIFGGSVAWHFTFHEGRARLLARLQESPLFEDRDIIFKSVSTGGVKQPQQLSSFNYLLTEGEEYDLVINLDGFNEIGVAHRQHRVNKAAPSYPRSWAQLIDRTPDIVTSAKNGEVFFLKTERGRLAKVFSAAPLRWSPTGNLIWLALDRFLGSRISSVEVELNGRQPETWTFRGQGPDQEYSEEQVLLRHLADTWFRSSVQMNAVAAAYGIDYHHFLQPNQYLPGSKPMGSTELAQAFDRDSVYREPVELGYPMLVDGIRELRSRGVDAHDLTQIFAGTQAQVYADNCCHLNAHGNEIMADAIAERILQRIDRRDSGAVDTGGPWALRAPLPG